MDLILNFSPQNCKCYLMVWPQSYCVSLLLSFPQPSGRLSHTFLSSDLQYRLPYLSHLITLQGRIHPAYEEVETNIKENFHGIPWHLPASVWLCLATCYPHMSCGVGGEGLYLLVSVSALCILHPIASSSLYQFAPLSYIITFPFSAGSYLLARKQTVTSFLFENTSHDLTSVKLISPPPCSKNFFKA